MHQMKADSKLWLFLLGSLKTRILNKFGRTFKNDWNFCWWLYNSWKPGFQVFTAIGFTWRGFHISRRRGRAAHTYSFLVSSPQSYIYEHCIHKFLSHSIIRDGYLDLTHRALMALSEKWVEGNEEHNWRRSLTCGIFLWSLVLAPDWSLHLVWSCFKTLMAVNQRYGLFRYCFCQE